MKKPSEILAEQLHAAVDACDAVAVFNAIALINQLPHGERFNAINARRSFEQDATPIHYAIFQYVDSMMMGKVQNAGRSNAVIAMLLAAYAEPGMMIGRDSVDRMRNTQRSGKTIYELIKSYKLMPPALQLHLKKTDNTSEHVHNKINAKPKTYKKRVSKLLAVA